MSRRVNLPSKEMGLIKILIIEEKDQVWEGHWGELQNSTWFDLIPRVSKEVMDHAFHGYTKPLVDKIGLSPAIILHKIPTAGRRCAYEGPCTLYDSKTCFVTAKALPNCYEPGDLPQAARTIAYEAICTWREGVYVVAVAEGL